MVLYTFLFKKEFFFSIIKSYVAEKIATNMRLFLGNMWGKRQHKVSHS